MKKVKIKKNGMMLLSLIVLVFVITAFTAIQKATFPKPSGAYAVGSFQVELTDKNRTDANAKGRKLLVQFYYPAQAQTKASMPYTPNPAQLESDLQHLYGVPKPLLRKMTQAQVPVQLNAKPVNTNQKFPLLLFSHGYNGSRFQNSFLLPELAAQGYIIASIEHTGSASGTVFQDGSVGRTTPFDSLMHNEPFSIREIEEWSLDQQFVLDQIEALSRNNQLSFSGLLNLNQVGVFGHSFGGATAAANLTKDKRFKAGINLDGFYFGNAYKSGFEQPFMEIRADNKTPEEMSDKDLKEWQFTREEYRNFLFTEWNKRIRSYARNGYESYAIRHANHMSFSDFSLMMPLSFITAPHREAHHRVTTHLILDFFNRNLKNAEATELPEHLRNYIK